MNAWTKDASRPVSATPATPQPSKIAVTFSNKWLVTRNNVLAVVKGEDDARLIDARPEAFAIAVKSSTRLLHVPVLLPGSGYFAHSKWFDGGSIIDESRGASPCEF